jgi:hypothetical protein
MEKMLSRDASKTFISGFLKNSHIPLFLYSKIEECNAIIGQTQIENIHNTLLLIENKYRTDKIDYYLRNHTQKCVNWCIKHGLEYIQQSHEEDACGVAVAGANIFMKKKDSYA